MANTKRRKKDVSPLKRPKKHVEYKSAQKKGTRKQNEHETKQLAEKQAPLMNGRMNELFENGMLQPPDMKGVITGDSTEMACNWQKRIQRILRLKAAGARGLGLNPGNTLPRPDCVPPATSNAENVSRPFYPYPWVQIIPNYQEEDIDYVPWHAQIA